MGFFLHIGYPLLFNEKNLPKVLRKPSSDPFGRPQTVLKHKMNGSRIFGDGFCRNKGRLANKHAVL
jgi:hypothetical protein